jgi:hypothetical protein
MTNKQHIYTFNDIVKKFDMYLRPYTKNDFNYNNDMDEDDCDAMISDVTGYLQVELQRRGCVLFVYSFDGYPTGEYAILGNPENPENPEISEFVPRCINPREPIYTEKSL